MSNRHPISEQYRVVAKQWVEADGAARLLEESKTATLEQRKVDLIREQGAMPDNAAERTVKASEEWRDYLEQMCNAREKANLLKVQLEYIRMKHQEELETWRNSRAEMRIVQSGADA